MSQSLSDEEFHRMQMQLIEMRTENYKLKDENRKNSQKLEELSNSDSKLRKELNKQLKLKRALSTLNKSKQAQEYETLLQETEQQFTLQNQTLMLELSKISDSMGKLEKENEKLKQSNDSGETNSDSETRRLQAQNTALKSNFENLQKQHEDEIKSLKDALAKANQTSTTSEHMIENPETENSHLQNNDSTEVVDGVQTNSVLNSSSLSLSNLSLHSNQSSSVNDEQFVHLQAECQRLRNQLSQVQDLQMDYDTELAEKKLLQQALSEAEDKHRREQKALSSEVDAFREKLDKKQATFLLLQDEKEKLYTECQNKSSEIVALSETSASNLHSEKERLDKEIASLSTALQNAHNLLEKQQSNIDSMNQQLKLFEKEKSQMEDQLSQLKEKLNQSNEKLSSQKDRFDNHSSMVEDLERKMKILEEKAEEARMERDDAVTKFEENARASGALLQRVDQVEQACEALQRELAESKELAERRKKVMDKQAVESQEKNAKFTDQINQMKSNYESTSKKSRKDFESKISALENTCKRQEQELIRTNNQDRSKTRELDSLQQKMRDMQSTVSSLENSRGWFERALKDAEKIADEKKEVHLADIESLKQEQLKEIEKIRQQSAEKDAQVAEAENRVLEALQRGKNKEKEIERLQQDIHDEVSKQRLVEKKGHSTLKDLKKQLIIEKKRNEKLQEKLKEFSSSNSNLDELLQVVDIQPTAEDGSSVSSFSFRDLISNNKINPTDSNSHAGISNVTSSPSVATAHVSKAETRDLLSRVTGLQQDKWHLEEQVRHLEESAGAMAEELIEKTKLMQDYVHHTRSDAAKSRSSKDLSSSRTFGNRMRSMITGQEEPDVANIVELNKKLTRMLEEEMMKNASLKEDLSNLTTQISSQK